MTSIKLTDLTLIRRLIALKNGDAYFSSTVETAWARLKDLLSQAMEIYIPKSDTNLNTDLSGLLLNYNIINYCTI